MALKPGPRPKSGVKRKTYSFSADPRLMEAVDRLIDGRPYENRSDVIAGALRLLLVTRNPGELIPEREAVAR